jgi:hypothetical protein
VKSRWPKAAVKCTFALKVALAVSLTGLTAFTNAETWRFALIGDTPYSDYERTELPRMLDDIANSRVDFVAHIGDFKHGKDRCDDGLFQDRWQLFNSSHVPFVYVPGDNEWTDCSRLSNGNYDPLERLNKLRELFWKEPQSLGQKRLRLERQPGSYPEHSRFRLGPVLFVTLNLPGDNNHWGMTTEPSSEFVARNPVVLDWVKESFALAHREKLAGIVLLFQANPGFKHFSQGFPHRGYRDFLDAVRKETTGFKGQVVLVHGDTHISRVDQPMRDRTGKTLGNLTRVETFGYPLMGWTHGIIETENPGLFRFEPRPWPPKQP